MHIFYFIIWGCITIARDVQHEINEMIRDREIRVIDADGEMIGIMKPAEARKLAEEAGLDLVKVSPHAKPPVCKILDYGKFRYEEIRKQKEAKKKQKSMTVKEIRMSVRVEEHDIQVKARNAEKFLQQGHRVKLTIRFRGREMIYTNQGRQVLLDFANRLKDYGTVTKSPKLEGRNMSIFLSPKGSKDNK
ncbi:MAG: translation initiation factor IF-3 [Eubacteriaceae bacterium]|uniref:Translation initiation factor IF-3 n=1 Tax=Candidatus Pseudoramibacter fermentans TaxID=2594427 RepID=A0A6L5GRQ9_9FIRM|nr:translation initiation factor IF-3 [Candidatus Pseudoramibacter fermentans]RRF93736.1 MAG: translation initiation factor IF-3 [Eubacteriaceae bacterium]